MFTYDKESDNYTCPQGSILRNKQHWYQHSEKHHKEGTGYKFSDMLPKTAKRVCHGLNAPRVKIMEGPLTVMKTLMQSKPMQRELMIIPTIIVSDNR